MIESVARSKLLPPRAPRRVVARDALLARLTAVRGQRCVVVRGPAGIGKTSLLAAWRQALLSLSHDVAWLSLSAEDDEPGRFFECLLAALGDVDPAMVRDAALLVGLDTDASAIEHWVVTLVQAIAGRPRDLTLVLDDAHCLHDSRIHQALQWMVDYAPPQLHLAIGTRAALPGLRGPGAIVEFGMDDLRFTPEESERFLRERLPGIGRQEVCAIQELTDGWAAGLQLLAIDFRKRRKSAASTVRLAGQLRDAHGFSAWFEQEVLANLPPDDLALLTRLAICGQYCAPLAAALMDEPRGGARMAARLSALDSRNPFVARVGDLGHETWYRLHPLLREILLARFAGLPAGAQRAVHAAAWRWFEGRGHPYDAVRHAIRAGEPEAAADVVEDHVSELLSRGELGQLASLVRELPPELVRSRLVLCLGVGYTQLYARDLEPVREGIAYMEATWGPSLSARGRYGLTLLRGALGLQEDDSDAVRRIMPELLALPDDVRDFSVLGSANVLSWMYMQYGEYGQARALLDEAARRGGASRAGLLGRCFAGVAMAMDGPIPQAERIYREVLEEAERHGRAFSAIACNAAGLLAHALYEANDCEAVCRLLHDRIDVLERVAPPDTVLRAMVVLADAHRLAGRRLEADDCLDRLHDQAVARGLDRVLAHALDLRLRWHLAQGEVDMAQAVLLRLESVGERHAGASAGTAWETWHVARCARVAMSLHWNDFGTARELLPPLIAGARAAGRKQRVAGLGLQLAIAERGLGHAGAARDAALDALRLAHEAGLVRSLLNMSPQVPALLDELLAEPPADAVLAFYLRRLRAAADAAPAQPAQDAAARATAPGLPDGLLNERERTVLDLLAQAMPNKKIARTIGVSPDTVKWNLKNIYAKLGVSSRDEAVARMRAVAREPAAG